MDLSLSADQRAVRDLARQIFTAECTDDRVRALEAGPERYDPDLWAALARAGLLGFGIPEADGGNGGGMIELCVLLEEAGRAAAPVPLWAATVTGSLPVARFGSDEQRARLLGPLAAGGPPVVAALDPSSTATLEDDRVTGTLEVVPAAAHAAAILVPAASADGVTLVVIDPADATIEPQREPGGEPLAQVRLEGARAEILAAGDEAVRWVTERARAGLCAWQTGVCDQAVRLTAAYLSEREQFGKPLGSFQAVQQRIADAYIDVEVMRWTMWQAAWRLDEGLPADEEVTIAKYWASEAGARALAAAQHLHGGIGVDMDHPLHRFTYLERQIELAMGGAARHLAHLGELIAR